ncbi:family 43 glycosylhydrolase [Streptomyces sp. URMC 126]|uniref:family 43 glycosylhydrolase n=1 Tax=Streptomyces sp. URMC 126 TaxID=3423401 RepID=UPI003F1D569A
MPHRIAVRRLSRLLAVAALLAVAVCRGPVPAGAAVGGPVLDHEFADPDVMKVGGTYHAYATHDDSRNVQHATSRDLVHWTLAAADALPAPGAWAEPRRELVWAPEVFDNGNGFTLQYTARDRAGGRQCVGAAVSASPDGPFRPVGDKPLVCPVEQGGAIDASVFTEGGRRYLLWKNDGNCCEMQTSLHLQPVSWDGTRTTGPAVTLLTRDREWEGRVVEAPTLVKRGGHYVLFYSADSYAGDAYKTGYAVADSLTGPYVKGSNPLMTTESLAGTVHGPGGQDVVTGPDGRDRVLFHGWSPDRTRRVMYAADLAYDGGRPVVRGGKARYEAEDATVVHAAVRDAVRASGGRAVGHVDEADSSVEFRVHAMSAGRHTLSVRFGNGSLEGGAPATASHTLRVNGADAGTVRYPYTGWDAWQEVEVTVSLRAGRNTVRLAKGERFAEVDCLDVDVV